MPHPAEVTGKRRDLRMTLALGGAVIAAVLAAFASSRTTHDAGVRAEELPLATTLAAPADEAPATDNGALAGRVLETLPVSKYTYLRLSTSGGEIWAAVPSASIVVGSRVAIENATRMVDFESTTLKRTFKAIYFGTIAAPSAGAAPKFAAEDVLALDDNSTLPPGHPDIGANTAPNGAVGDDGTLPPGHPEIGGTSQPQPVAGGVTSESSLPTIRIDPARGRNAHVISELTTQRQRLAGQRVRVRGQVTKVTAGIQGRAFFHLRDASEGQQTDLVVTSVVPPERGQVATFEGTLRIDVDVGVGFNYPVLLQDATLLKD